MDLAEREEPWFWSSGNLVGSKTISSELGSPKMPLIRRGNLTHLLGFAEYVKLTPTQCTWHLHLPPSRMFKSQPVALLLPQPFKPPMSQLHPHPSSPLARLRLRQFPQLPLPLPRRPALAHLQVQLRAAASVCHTPHTTLMELARHKAKLLLTSLLSMAIAWLESTELIAIKLLLFLPLPRLKA